MNRIGLIVALALAWITYSMGRSLIFALAAVTCFSVSVLLSTLDDDDYSVGPK